MEAGRGRSSREKRGPAGIEAPGPGALAELERVPSPQQGGNENELRELLGQRLTARDFDRQVAEVQIRVAVLNRFTALGIPTTVAIG